MNSNSENDDNRKDMPEEVTSWEELFGSLQEDILREFGGQSIHGFIPRKIEIEQIPGEQALWTKITDPSGHVFENKLSPITALLLAFAHLSTMVHGSIEQKPTISAEEFLKYSQESLLLLIIQYFQGREELSDFLQDEKRIEKLEGAVNMAAWELAEILQKAFFRAGRRDDETEDENDKVV